ncbi:metalloregulator ArsR/SmtB family transcription factor [Paenibacillus humicus]
MELKKNQDTCEIFCYDEDKVNRVREKLSKNDFQDMAQIFKVLADHTRLKVAYALCDEDELCVCDVANIIGSTMATASHHLRLLRNMGIANYRKEGKLVFYSLGDEQLKQMIRLAIEHQKEVVGVE